MTVADLQAWLNTRGASLAVDGKSGPATRAAIIAAFTNRSAPAVTNAELETLATRLGCTRRQLATVAAVESSGSGFDRDGRPKILFERHKFHALTNGRWSVCGWSNPSGGGYSECSWEKLTRAAGQDPDAAFAAASWGKFQVLGLHWRALGYASPLELAYSTVSSEAAHYELLARYVAANGMKPALAAISDDPDDCRAFAKGYNGPAYERFSYHKRLAAAFKRERPA